MCFLAGWAPAEEAVKSTRYLPGIFPASSTALLLATFSPSSVPPPSRTSEPSSKGAAPCTPRGCLPVRSPGSASLGLGWTAGRASGAPRLLSGAELPQDLPGSRFLGDKAKKPVPLPPDRHPSCPSAASASELLTQPAAALLPGPGGRTHPGRDAPWPPPLPSHCPPDTRTHGLFLGH